ncbi:Acg family FMN-binding oxidoreductase [Parafrankia discariae]|uniref:Acg family FMN-binding oxidoreductase n=1 Tax=Parafrankia discariae TaxID=365528 RepID=UPI0003791AF8|nr:nitroreductase [Parafrankia discariae]
MVDTAVRLTEDDARAIVAQAALAPSIHNTQPWRWRFDAEGLHLFADPGRLLHVADPEGRQLLVSCGAALTFARLAARSRGLLPVVALGPLDDGAPPSADVPLATIAVADRRPAAPAEAELAAAMADRHTDRRPFLAGERGRLGADDLAALRRAAEAESAWVRFVESADARVETSVLLSRADWQEAHDPAYAEELRHWSRTSPQARDGIPREAVVGGAATRQSEFVLRDFDVVGGLEPGPDPAGSAVERPTVVAIGTDSDRPTDRLLAGGATGRVLLTATARGLAASPLGQVLDVSAIRELMRSATGGLGHIQMLLRLGRPDPGQPPLAATPRRPVEEILDLA